MIGALRVSGLRTCYECARMNVLESPHERIALE